MANIAKIKIGQDAIFAPTLDKNNKDIKDIIFFKINFEYQNFQVFKMLENYRTIIRK